MSALTFRVIRASLVLAVVVSALRPGLAAGQPVQPAGAPVLWTSIAAGNEHTCALTSAGGVKCWGENSTGQLGTATTISSSMPVDVWGLTSGVSAVDSGVYHTCALTTAGGTKCWGDNNWGQLGNGTTADSSTPMDVIGLTSGVSALSTGHTHTCALTTAGGVKCWGDNEYGQLGSGATGPSYTPADVIGLTSGVSAVSTGDQHTCALTTAGGVKCWGQNSSGQLGNGTTTNSATPVDVTGLTSEVIAVSAGLFHTCALTSSGSVKCWGSNQYGQLGNGTTTASATPLDVTGLASGAIAVTAGGHDTCAVTSGGGVKCWGYNRDGQLGNGGTIDSLVPVDVAGLTDRVSALSASTLHTCVVTSGGAARCWGNNEHGQLGDGTRIDKTLSLEPVDVSGLTSGVAAVAAGYGHACALTRRGGVQCWGKNDTGELGNGSWISTATPVDVTGLTNGTVAVVTGAGAQHTCAVTTAGGVKCWGNNAYGQLGDGTTTSRNTPVDVIGLTSGVSAVAVGHLHTCAVTAAGGVKCWGDNRYGKLGNLSGQGTSTPKDVIELTSGITAVVAGAEHTCALTDAGGMKCWGRTSEGQVGDGDVISGGTERPQDVTGLTNGVIAMAAGGYHTCALTNAGGLKCWGENRWGTLGTGTTTLSAVPVDVTGLMSGVSTVAAGGWRATTEPQVAAGHTCAVTAAGGVSCWGSNAFGQLGNGTKTWSSTPLPVDVAFLASGVRAAAAGRLHTCAVTAAGGVTCWGSNAFGQLGDGSQTYATKPVAVIPVTTDPSELQFAATKAGAAGDLIQVTAPQTVLVSVTGGSTTWAAAADQPWVQLTRASGTNAGQFTVSIVNPGHVLGGASSVWSRITIAPDTVGWPSTFLDVHLTIDQTGGSATAPPFGLVDTPVQNTTGVAGSIGVTGWALDDVGIASVQLYRNCLAFEPPANCQVIGGHHVVYMGDADIVPGVRPDVEALYPTYPQAYRAGWGYLLLTNMLPHIQNQLMFGGQGSLSIYVLATDMEGHQQWLGRTTSDGTPTTVTMANDTAAKPFGAIDTPGQGHTVSGALWNFGWALTPDSNTVADAGDILAPTDGSTMWVWIDGALVGTVTYNWCRGTVPTPTYCDDDVASIFGNLTPQPTYTSRSANPTKYRNLDAGRGAIGAYYLDTTTLSNGRHSIVWSVTDSAGRADGIGSRYFNVLNAGAPAVPIDAAARIVGDAAAVAGRPVAAVRVWGRTGFDVHAPLEILEPDGAGTRHVQLPGLGRLELSLGKEITAGYLVANETLRPLPTDSRLADGRFTWAPPVGYIGTYDLVFMTATEQVPVQVTIRAASEQPRIEGYIDAPTANATVRGSFDVAGWAADVTAWTGTGIGAVHVWAWRRDAPAAAVFLGAATLGRARPDVGAQLGAQFEQAGWGLATSGLGPGDYDITAYFWSTARASFADARTVRVNVR